MTGQAWIKLLYYVGRATKECKKHKDIKPTQLADFLVNGNQSEVDELVRKAYSHLNPKPMEGNWDGYTNLIGGKFIDDQNTQNLAVYLNSRMLDNEWKDLIQDIKRMEYA